jgi:hypothetical protein
MRSRALNSFFRFAAITLVVLAVAKIVDFLARPQPTHYFDPIIPTLTVRESALLGVMAESFVAMVLMVSQSPRTKAWALTLLCSLLLSYRASYVLFGVKLPCKCLGILQHWLQLSPGTNDALAIGLLGVLTAGGYYAFWSVEMRRGQTITQEVATT